jgi:hypothetical protein
MRAQGRVRLLAIPGASVRRAKPLDDAHHRRDCGEVRERVERREHEEPGYSGAVALRVGDGARAVRFDERDRVRRRITPAEECPVDGGVESDRDRAERRERVPIEAACRDEIDAGGPALEDGGECRRATRTRGRG